MKILINSVCPHVVVVRKYLIFVAANVYISQ